MYGKKLTEQQRNFIWAQYVAKRGYYKSKLALYNDIAVFVGCGWQTVYNYIRRELDKRQYKLFQD